MFKLYLDISLIFVPPMEEQRPGICLSREFELPFMPFAGLHLTGSAFNEVPNESGTKLGNVTWDIDRMCFLADTSSTHINLPLAFVPDEIRSWINRGWKLGSYEDVYEAAADDSAGSGDDSPVLPKRDYERMERWPAMTPRSRPPEFNKFLRALVREMASLYNNLPTAYAIDQTNTFISDDESKDRESRGAKKYRDARRRYRELTVEQQSAWQQGVLRRYPRLEQVL